MYQLVLEQKHNRLQQDKDQPIHIYSGCQNKNMDQWKALVEEANFQQGEKILQEVHILIFHGHLPVKNDN